MEGSLENKFWWSLDSFPGGSKNSWPIIFWFRSLFLWGFLLTPRKQISYFTFHEASLWLPSSGVLESAWWWKPSHQGWLQAVNLGPWSWGWRVSGEAELDGCFWASTSLPAQHSPAAREAQEHSLCENFFVSWSFEAFVGCFFSLWVTNLRCSKDNPVLFYLCICPL